MKNLAILFFLFTALSLQAQNFCEVDLTNSNLNNEMGCRVLKTSDDNFITLSLSETNGYPYDSYRIITLTKLGNCGEIIWRKKFDSSTIWISSIWEENSNIEFTATHVDKLSGKQFIRLYKVSNNGELIWKTIVGDTSRSYLNNTCLKIDKNKYFYLSRYYINSKSYPTYMICDSLGKIIIKDSIIADNIIEFSSLALKTDNTILILGRMIDTSNFILKVDTDGNILSIKNFKIYPHEKFLNIGLNYDCNEIFYVSYLNENSLRISRLNLQGQILKDSIFTNTFLTYSIIYEQAPSFQFLPNNKILYSNNGIVLIDSNFKVAFCDSLNKLNFQINHSILTNDSFITSIGTGNIMNGGTGMRFSNYWFRKKSIHQLVQLLTLSGPSLINTNKGSVQITSSIAPTGANNKNILWSINDTNLATITQTGLLTAKANGTVIVTATAADGGGAKATKAFTISNQNVGINEINLTNPITIYPNPASNVLTINQINANFSYKIINLQGQEILNGELKKPFSSIDISKLEAGSYIIGLTTESGIYWKKFIKN